jgi:hypothetical protein
VINSQATSVTSLTPHLSAIMACFVFWVEICHPAFSDFCSRNGRMGGAAEIGESLRKTAAGGAGLGRCNECYCNTLDISPSDGAFASTKVKWPSPERAA